jgi:hypothetical protein
MATVSVHVGRRARVDTTVSPPPTHGQWCVRWKDTTPATPPTTPRLAVTATSYLLLRRLLRCVRAAGVTAIFETACSHGQRHRTAPPRLQSQRRRLGRRDADPKTATATTYTCVAVGGPQPTTAARATARRDDGARKSKTQLPHADQQQPRVKLTLGDDHLVADGHLDVVLDLAVAQVQHNGVVALDVGVVVADGAA